MEMVWNYTTGRIIVDWEDKTRTITDEDERFERVKQALIDEQFEVVVSMFEAIDREKRSVEFGIKETPFYIDEYGNVFVNDEQVPQGISAKIKQFIEEGIKIDPLVEFWDQLKENPSFRARNDLFGFLEQNGHPITDDGHFIAYRGATYNENGDLVDGYTKTMNNNPGSVCEMPREKVNDDPTETCSSGLHIASYDYAYRRYGYGEKKAVIKVKVNPADVVCFPIDYANGKCRCCRFEVLALCDEPVNKVFVDNEDYDDYDEDDYGCEYTYDEAFEEGKEAANCAALSAEDNPYDPESEDAAHSGWDDGYHQELEEIQERAIDERIIEAKESKARETENEQNIRNWKDIGYRDGVQARIRGINTKRTNVPQEYRYHYSIAYQEGLRDNGPGTV